MAGLLPLLLGHDSGAISFPTMRVEVAFDYGPTIGEPVFTDITDYVRGFNTRRGKSRELDKNQAGNCGIVLDNRDRRFDPDYASGPYFGKLLPMKRVRIRMTHDTTYPVFDGYVDSWDQQYEKPNNATCVLSATDGFKPLAAALLARSPYEVEVLADSPALWFRLGEGSGSTTVTDQIAAFQLSEFGTGITLGADGLVLSDSDTALSETGTTSGFSGTRSLFTNGSSSDQITVEVIVQTSSVTDSTVVSISDPGTGARLRLRVASGLLNFQVGETEGSTSTSGIDSTTSVNDGEPHHIVAVWDRTQTTDQRLYVDGVEESNSGAGSAINGAAGASQEICIGNVATGFVSPAAHTEGLVGTIDEVAVYLGALSAERVAAHAAAALTPWAGDTPGERIARLLDFIDWPSLLRSLDTGSSVLQASDIDGAALAHAQLVAESEFGDLFMTADGKVRLVGRTSNVNQTSQATFGDSGSELRYTNIEFDYSDELIRNDVRIGRVGGALQRSEDATSIESFLRHTYQQDGLIHNSDIVSRNAADFLVDQYKDPKLRVTQLTIAPQQNSSGLWPQMLGRELGDWVTIVRRPQGVGTEISQVCRIEGISHSYDAQDSLHWETVWQLSPALAGEENVYWELGTSGFSELGETTRLYF